MRFVIALRHTEDWLSLDWEEYTYHHSSLSHNPNKREQYEKNMQWWKDLGLSLFEYRHHLKKVAMSQWPLPWIEFEEALSLNDPNTILIPLDDDDIINPDISWLEEVYNNGTIDAVTWNTWTYSVLNYRDRLIEEHKCEPRDQRAFWNPSSVIPSNCYSIRSNMAADNQLRYHQLFSANKSICKYHTPYNYGLRFIHPASIWHIQNRSVAHGEYMHVLDDIPIPQELDWGREFIDSTTQLTRKVFQKSA